MHIALASEELQYVFVKYVYKLFYLVSIYLMIVHTYLLVY